MDRNIIPFLALTLLLAASGCSQQPAPRANGAPPQPAIGEKCLPPGPCDYPGGGTGGFIR